MNMKKNILLLILLSTVFTAVYSQNKIIRQDTIRDNNIQAPETMTESLSKLLYDWQLNFSTNDANCKNGFNVTYPDSVYIQKLSKLPTRMELSFNSIVKKYIDIYTSQNRSQVSYMLALGEYYFPIFEQMLDKYGLPLELKYLPVIESNLNPSAVSRSGATGLWQFMLPTAQGYGLEVTSLVDERRDPYKASEAAARHLKDLYNIFKDWELVIAAYNSGATTVTKAIQRSGGKQDYWSIYYNLPAQTRGYVPAFIATNYIMNYYADHNICPMKTNSFVGLDTVNVRKEFHLEQIANVLNIPILDLRRMNPQFRDDIIPGNYKPYSIVLPINKMLAFLGKNEEILNYRKDQLLSHRAVTEKYINPDKKETKYKNTYHTVKRGESLKDIANKYDVSVSQLKSWNNLRRSTVSRGKKLIVNRTIEDDSLLLVNDQTLEPSHVTELSKEDKKTDNAVVNRLSDETKSTNKPVSKPKNTYYTVKKGDNLEKIANKFDISVSRLKNMNDLSKNIIQPGDKLIVGKSNNSYDSSSNDEVSSKSSNNKKTKSQSSKSKNTYYTIKEGDNLDRIARKYGTTVKKLKAMNGLTKNTIQPGDKLVVKKK